MGSFPQPGGPTISRSGPLDACWRRLAPTPTLCWPVKASQSPMLFDWIIQDCGGRGRKCDQMVASLPEQLNACGDDVFVCRQTTDELWATIFEDHAATQKEPSDQLDVFWCQLGILPTAPHAHLCTLV